MRYRPWFVWLFGVWMVVVAAPGLACPPGCTCANPFGRGGRLECRNDDTLTSVTALRLNLAPTSTVELDLSGNKIVVLERGVFSSLPALERLYLNNNQIQLIEPGAFVNLTELQILDLSSNQLVYLNGSIFQGLEKLQKLILAGNDISRITEGVFEPLASIQTLNLTNNRIICDCHLQWIVRWARNAGVSYTSGSVCKFPDKMQGRTLRKLKKKDLHCDWPPQVPVFELSPFISQIVFEGDQMVFRCRISPVESTSQLLWVHNNQRISSGDRAHSSVVIEVQKSPDGSTISSSLHINRLNVAHTGNWGCEVTMPKGNESRSVNILVISDDTKHCPQTATSNNKGRYIWPKTVVGVTIELPCEGHKAGSHGYQLPHAYHTCNNQGFWEHLNTSQCPYVNEVTKVLEQFSKTNLTLTKANVLESARRLRNYTGDGSMLRDKMDIVFISRTVENYLNFVSRQKEIGEVLIDVVSTVMRLDKKLLRAAQSQDRACSRLVQAIEKIPELVTEGTLNRYRDNLAVEEFIVKPDTFSGIMCTSYVRALSSQGRISDALYNEKVFHCNIMGSASIPDSVNDKVIEASIQLPSSLFTEVSRDFTLNSSHKLQFTIYRNSKLFPPSDDPHQRRKEVATSVISSRLAKLSVDNLTHPVTVMLRTPIYTADVTPVWWDFSANDNLGDWSSEGCDIIDSDKDENLIIFHCNRLANFGLLQDAEQLLLYRNRLRGAKFRLSHPAIYIGSTVCIICLIVVIVTYVCCCRAIKMPKKAKHSLVNTCLSLALLCFLFCAGVYQTENTKVCQSVGILLHYFTLCTLFWMIITVSNMYKKLTKTDPPEPPADEPLPDYPIPKKPMLRFYLIGWGIAIIICGISGAINMEYYAGYYYCFLAFGPSLGAFYGPVGALVFFLCIFFCLIQCVVSSLEGSSEENPVTEPLELELVPGDRRSLGAHSVSTVSIEDLEHPPILQLRAQAVVLLLFLLTWASAAIATAHPFADQIYHEEAIFSCFYGVLSSTLGCFILIFFCVSRQDIRACWRRIGYCRRWRNVYDTSLPAPPLTNSNGHVRQSTNSLESNFTNKSSHTSRSYETGAKAASVKLSNINLVSSSHTTSITDTSFTGAELFYNPRQNGVARRFFEKNRQQQIKLLQQQQQKISDSHTDGGLSSECSSAQHDTLKQRLHGHHRIGDPNFIGLLPSQNNSSAERESVTTDTSQVIHITVNPSGPSNMILVPRVSPKNVGAASNFSDRNLLISGEDVGEEGAGEKSATPPLSIDLPSSYYRRNNTDKNENYEQTKSVLVEKISPNSVSSKHSRTKLKDIDFSKTAPEEVELVSRKCKSLGSLSNNKLEINKKDCAELEYEKNQLQNKDTEGKQSCGPLNWDEQFQCNERKTSRPVYAYVNHSYHQKVAGLRQEPENSTAADKAVPSSPSEIEKLTLENSKETEIGPAVNLGEDTWLDQDDKKLKKETSV